MKEIQKIKDTVALTEEVVRALKKGGNNISVIDKKGKEIFSLNISPDMLHEWEKYYKNVDEGEKIKGGRDAAVDKEISAVGNKILPLHQEVVIKGGLEGKIVQISSGYRERPYYRVFLKNAENEYGDPEDESNYGFFYARDFRNYGQS